jgi:hypothetical protein
VTLTGVTLTAVTLSEMNRADETESILDNFRWSLFMTTKVR